MECVMTRNAQQPLDFGVAYSCEQEFKTSMRALEDAYVSAGNLVVAGATGIDKGDLPKMFEPGSGRHLRYKAVFQIGRLASMEMRRKLLEPLASHLGFGLCEPVPLTDKERADRLESLVRSMPLGDQLVSKTLGGAR